MDPILVVTLIVGAVLPALVGAAVVVLWMPRGAQSGWSMPLAFGKGIAFGIVLGASVSLAVVALTLAGARLLQD
jgi:hypothetical protein